MTADDARRIYLSFAGAEEGSHMGHPDFRIRGRIFATLWPDKALAVLRLPMEIGEALASDRSDVFGLKGRSGGWAWLVVDLASADSAEFQDLAELAFERRR